MKLADVSKKGRYLVLKEKEIQSIYYESDYKEIFSKSNNEKDFER
jgi:hypothetical protein